MTDENFNHDETYLTAGEVACLMGVSKFTVLRMLKKRAFSTHKTPGGHNRIPQSEVDAYLDENFIPKADESESGENASMDRCAEARA